VFKKNVVPTNLFLNFKQRETMPQEDTERQLFLKQLQINRLLDITQAINNNVNADTLYVMYRSFLNWELGVRKIALFLPEEDSWKCVVTEGVKLDTLDSDVPLMLPKFGNTMKKVNDMIHPFTRQFEMVIPVFHKEDAIAYAFIGGYDGSDFGKLQLITTITNIVAVAIENKRLFKRKIEQERFNHEISLAKEMQNALIPDKMPKNDAFEVSAIYKPHFGVGGDYFDCFKLKEDRYMFIVADVAGKGLSAALLMANFQANMHAIIRRILSPEEFIRQLNKAVYRVTNGDKYITLFVAELDLNTRRFRYINAGHIPPVLIRKDGEVEWLKKGCMILGYEPSLPKLEIGEITLDTDAMMVIYTDGLTDIKSPDGTEFDEDMLASFVDKNQKIGARAFNEKLMKQIDDFKAGEDFPDDITILTCRFFEKVAEYA
jgi:phosphoserine phosphatase RsbU/P